MHPQIQHRDTDVQAGSDTGCTKLNRDCLFFSQTYKILHTVALNEVRIFLFSVVKSACFKYFWSLREHVTQTTHNLRPGVPDDSFLTVIENRASTSGRFLGSSSETQFQQKHKIKTCQVACLANSCSNTPFRSCLAMNMGPGDTLHFSYCQCIP